MNILVISDSHGLTDPLQQIVGRINPDHVIHCGDFCIDTEQLPQKPSLTYVQGNCDFASAPKEQVWDAKGLRFYVTHGHHYQVKSSPLPIRLRAQEVGANIVCFGHSHLPFCEQSEGMLLINPGSLLQPRGFSVPTYAYIQLGDREADVTYYQTDGTFVPQLGGHYAF